MVAKKTGQTTKEKPKKGQGESQEQQSVADAFDSRVVSISRTTKVREGGRDFKFSAVAVVGDGAGRIGYGRGKAKEVVIAVQKATDDARRNMITVRLKGGTIQYPLIKRTGSTRVVILPGANGTGIIAGGAMRPVFEVLGVKNVIAKCIGSTNPVNVVRTTIECLEQMVSPREVAAKRGKHIAEVLGKNKKRDDQK
jgi:small subunit ribosomal protein S5